jgi:hypothetical protein
MVRFKSPDLVKSAFFPSLLHPYLKTPEALASLSYQCADSQAIKSQTSWTAGTPLLRVVLPAVGYGLVGVGLGVPFGKKVTLGSTGALVGLLLGVASQYMLRSIILNTCADQSTTGPNDAVVVRTIDQGTLHTSDGGEIEFTMTEQKSPGVAP